MYKYGLLLFLVFKFLVSCKGKESEKQQPLQENDPIFQPYEALVLSSGKLLRVENFPSKFITPRPVDIWLPNNYSQDNVYSVLYMHDGQSLFDATATWNKQEWKVDEWATLLMNEQATVNFIVVATHNIPDIRWQDYFPQKAFDYLSNKEQDSLRAAAKANNFSLEFKADDYLKFLVEELKPVVDRTFSTHKDRANTFVAGSSMGGLISMYAICEYPEVFGGAGCISTHWPGLMPAEHNPLPEAIFAYMNDHLPDPNNHRFYFDYGTETLDAHYPQYASDVDAIFHQKGYTDVNFKNLKFEGENHSESSWQKRLDVPFTFLMKR